MRSFWKWLSGAYPHDMLLAAFIALLIVYVGEWLIMALLFAIYGVFPDNWRHVVGYRLGLVALLATVAVWRSVFINPACAFAYRQWLETTPWTPRKRLPLGSVELTWQDMVLVVAAMGLLLMWPAAWLLPLALLLPYSYVMTRLNFRAGQDAAAFGAAALGALLPLSLTMLEQPWLPAVLTGAWTLVSLWGWRRAVLDYPWDHLPRWNYLGERRDPRRKDKAISLWWPRVHPWPTLGLKPILSWREILTAAALAAWYTGVAVYTAQAVAVKLDVENDPEFVKSLENFAYGVAMGIGFLAAIFRLVVYVASCAPPISVWGRWATGRLIIPGYDRVLAPPPTTVAVTLVLPQGLSALGVPLALMAFLTVLTSAIMAMGLGPSLAERRLTGEYRMVRRDPANAAIRGPRGTFASGAG